MQCQNFTKKPDSLSNFLNFFGGDKNNVYLHEYNGNMWFYARKYEIKDASKINVFMSVGRIYIFDVCRMLTFETLKWKLEKFKEKNQHKVDYLEESGRNYIIVGLIHGMSHRVVEFEMAY